LPARVVMSVPPLRSFGVPRRVDVEQIAPPIADRAAQRDISGAGAGGPMAFGVIPCATGS
jgi:hypothetical protein